MTQLPVLAKGRGLEPALRASVREELGGSASSGAGSSTRNFSFLSRGGRRIQGRKNAQIPNGRSKKKEVPTIRGGRFSEEDKGPLVRSILATSSNFADIGREGDGGFVRTVKSSA